MTKDNRIIVFGFCLGAFAALVQVVLLRESLSLAGGNELVVSIGFAAWLAGVSAGAIIARKLPTREISWTAMPFVASVLVIGATILLRFHRSVFDLSLGTEVSLAQLTSALSVALSTGGLAVGALFVVASGRLRRPGTISKSSVSILYASEAVGTLVLGALFAFGGAEMIGHLGALGIASSLLLLGTATLCRHRSAPAILLICGVIFLISSLTPWADALEQLTEKTAFARLRGRAQLVRTTKSPYGNLWLSRTAEQFELFSDGRFVRAFPDPWNRQSPIHLALTQHPNPQKVLIIGGGPSDRIEVALDHGAHKVVLTHMDSKVPQLCADFWTGKTQAAVLDPRTEMVVEDGMRYLGHTKEKFDVIFVSAPPPLTAAANRYYTRRFFAQLKRALSRDGALTILAPGGANVITKDAARITASLLKTVRAELSHTVLVPGIQIILHASPQPDVLSSQSTVLAERFKQRNITSTHFSWRRFEDIMDPARAGTALQAIEQTKGEINTELNPKAFIANLKIWERSISSAGQTADVTFLDRLEQWRPVLLILFAALWLPGLAFGLRKKKLSASYSCLFAIGTTGAAGMAGQIIVILVYQAASGQLYQMLALLNAVFMGGLTLGALGAHLVYDRFKSPRRVALASDLTALVFFVLLGVFIGAAIEHSWLSYLFSALNGIVTGMAFPIFLKILAHLRQVDEPAVASPIEAVDHLGAALGAFVTGMVLIPSLGVVGTCLLCGGVKALSSTLIGLGRFDR